MLGRTIVDVDDIEVDVVVGWASIVCVPHRKLLRNAVIRLFVIGTVCASLKEISRHRHDNRLTQAEHRSMKNLNQSDYPLQ